ncbi:transcription termination factor NusA [Metamycoplasma neophronis]|uniref:Transcription termination/antitermination protein NusA n=1 Tax=Metamycoplasma neophronis TaxID=872983 RepID=A0ABY2Z0L6_9BACT|nr:transcription termination factor NusA [Metamycoplasma neophronis]TPR54695.1 transcription termination factor NusA [Metamycoplasma neophronis]
MSESNNSSQKVNEIFTEIYNLSNIRKLDEHRVLELFKNAISKVILEQYDEEADLEFIIDEQNKTFKVINHAKTIIPDPVSDEDKDTLSRCVEIPISIAREINPHAEIDETMSEEVNFEVFNKRDYNKILAVFSQSLRELEKELTYQKYMNKIGEVLKAKIVSFKKMGILLEFIEDGASAFMPTSLTNQRYVKTLHAGDVIDVYVEEVRPESRDAQVVVSSVESKLLQTLLAKEIPEVAEGLIEIVKIARIAGERSKIAIRKAENAPEGMEEIGAIIGAKSERIESISKQLKGEKIDIILYSDDLKTYIMNAISPSKVIDIVLAPNSKPEYPSFIVVVPNTQHTLAIGKKGQNVSLASELVKARLDILSQAQANEQAIKYDINNGNITEDEIKELENGKRLQSNFKKRPNNRNNNFNTFETNFNIDEFDADLAELRQKAQLSENVFEKQMFASSLDDDIEATLELIKDDLENLESDEEVDFDPYSASIEEIAKKDEEAEADYEKITSTKMKDFKKDDDLSAGLENIDLSDLDNEDW